MSEVIIKIENLWKEYRYGSVTHEYLFRDLQSWWAKARGREDPNSRLMLDIRRETLDAKKGNTKALDVGKLDEKGEAIKASNVKRQTSNDAFWALRDINLEVKQGEILGIIGRNGAGK